MKIHLVHDIRQTSKKFDQLFVWLTLSKHSISISTFWIILCMYLHVVNLNNSEISNKYCLFPVIYNGTTKWLNPKNYQWYRYKNFIIWCFCFDLWPHSRLTVKFVSGFTFLLLFQIRNHYLHTFILFRLSMNNLEIMSYILNIKMHNLRKTYK